METDRSEWHAEIHGSGEVGEAVAVRSGHVEVDGLLRPPVSPRSELAALGSVESQPVDVVGRGPAKTSRCLVEYSLVCYFGSKYLSLGPSCGHNNGCIKNFQ